MSVTWHIVRKDLFRLRWGFALWATLLGAYAAFASIQSNLDDGGYYSFLIVAWIFGTLFLPMFGIGLVMGVFSDDSANDSDAFWVTRPISGARMLAAKVVVLLLLVPVPALVLLPWWVANGLTLSQLASSAGATVGRQLSLFLFALPFAILSVTISHFVTSIVVAIVSFATLAGLAFWFSFAPTPAQQPVLGQFFGGLWIAASALVLANQYLSRKTSRSLALFGAALALGLATLLIFKRWHWHEMSVGENAPAIAVARRAALTPAAGASFRHDGHRVKIIEVIPNDPVGVIMTLSESESTTRSAPWEEPLQAAPPPVEHEAYFLINPTDGHWVKAHSMMNGAALTAGTLHFSRRLLVFQKKPDWPAGPNFDFVAWMNGATLVKFVAPSELVAPPSLAGIGSAP